MPAFEFLKNAFTRKWIILAPRRAHRPDIAHGKEPVCPFCEAKDDDGEIMRVNGEDGSWLFRVLPNKFPFAPTHELIIDTPVHNGSFDSFSVEHITKLFSLYRDRYNEHSHKGQVFIFHNHGQKSGESIPHSHTQIAVFPEKVYVDAPFLESIKDDVKNGLDTPGFTIVCPATSQWPDEAWIVPKTINKAFGEITDKEISLLSQVFSTMIRLYTLRYNNDFPYNFYINPGTNWYIRMIPRNKTLGGVEVGTNIYVNTQDPKETMEFIKTHFFSLDEAKINAQHQADYSTHV